MERRGKTKRKTQKNSCQDSLAFKRGPESVIDWRKALLPSKICRQRRDNKCFLLVRTKIQTFLVMLHFQRATLPQRKNRAPLNWPTDATIYCSTCIAWARFRNRTENLSDK